MSNLPSKTFCILPWTHFFHDPTGKIKPCCASKRTSDEFGTVHSFDTVQDLVNSEPMKQVRRDMLAGKENVNCTRCYEEESHALPSFRSHKNTDIEHLNINVDQLVKNTDIDGTLNNFCMEYWDIRFSNICNLKCRMCGPDYSNTWGDDSVAIHHRPKLKNYVIHSHNEQTIDMERYYGNLSELKEVYFAGGESLFQQEHWDLLEHLTKIGKQDIRFTYTTNLTKLNFGQRHLKDYLPKFSNVLFIVSADGEGAVGEYIRSGLDWDKLVENINFVKQFPGVKLKFNTVISIYNILYLDKFFDFVYSITNGPNLIDLSPCHHPKALHVSNIPTELKDLARDRLLASPHYNKLKDRIDGVISLMYSPPVANWDTVMKFTNQLDQLRNESVLAVVPEFKQYWK